MDDTKKALVFNTYTVVIEGNTEMVDKKMRTKTNVVKEYITLPISAKKNIYTVNKTDKSRESNKAVDKYRSNKNDKVKSIDKSRSTQITNTEKAFL